jgi:hypothetical protein
MGGRRPRRSESRHNRPVASGGARMGYLDSIKKKLAGIALIGALALAAGG